VDGFLNYQYGVHDLPFFHKSPFIWRDNIRKKGFSSFGGDFVDDLVGYIIEGNSAKMSKRGRV